MSQDLGSIARDAAASAPATGHRVDQATRDRWGCVLIVVVWAWSVVPRLVQTLTAPKYRVSLGEESIPDSALASLTNTGLTLFVMGFAALCVLRCHEPGQRAVPGILLVVLAPWAYVVLRDVFDRDMPRKDALVYPLVVLAVWAVRPRIRVAATLGYLSGAATVLSLLLGVLLPSAGLFRLSSGETVTQDKSLLPIGTLIGFLTQGNNLGVLLVLGLPFLALIRPRWARLLLVALTVFALVWTASRGSLAAMVVGALVATALAPLSGALRRSLGPVAAMSPLVAVVVLPLATTDPAAFTNRGAVWVTSIGWWQDNIWFGLGSDFYAEVAMTTARISGSTYHGHNQFVHLVTTGGIVLVALVVVLLCSVAVAAGRWARTTTSGIVFLAILTSTMLLERPVGFVDNLNVFPLVILPIALLLLCRLERTEDEDEEPGLALEGPAVPSGTAVSGQPPVGWPYPTR